MASRGDKGNGNGEEQIVEVNRYGLHFLTVIWFSIIIFLYDMMVVDTGWGIPLLHLYGKAGGCTPMSALLEVVLLLVCQTMADRTAVPMSALSCCPASARTSQLSLGGGSHPADRDHATKQQCHSARKYPWQVSCIFFSTLWIT